MTTTARLLHDLSMVACAYGMVYPLTECCSASGKGSEDGVVCRNCYQVVDWKYGDCALLTDPDLHARIKEWTNVSDEEVERTIALFQSLKKDA